MSRDYLQFCGLAHALELVGSRWSLLIVRDLLSGPKRFTDLRAGLPGIPTNVLSGRLRDLEDAGVVRRQVQPRPSSGIGYELTEYGAALEEPLVALGMWGARSMGTHREGAFSSIPAWSLALRGMFHPDKARGRATRYTLGIDGQTLGISIDEGALHFGTTDAAESPVVIETDSDTLFALLSGRLALRDAVSSGHATTAGRRTDAQQFFEIFTMDEADLEPSLG
jgi:DNA-binding HxlR family transcriptional regulator